MNTNAKRSMSQPDTARRIKAQRAAPGDRRVYCVDLAKEYFHVNCYNAGGEQLSSKGLSRSQFQKLLSDPQRPRAMWVMEACGGAYHWSRILLAQGDEAKLVPPQFVAKQRIGNKNDSNDAAAIFAVHLDARVHPVPVKSAAQQAQLAVHAARQQLIKSQTATSNHLRSLLAEQGYVTAKGLASLRFLVSTLTEIDTAAKLDRAVQVVIISLRTMLETLAGQIAVLDQQIKLHVDHSVQAKRLMQVPGIGPITASAAVAEYDQGVQRFTDARQFAASLGITPGEHSSGGKTRLGAVTKRGNAYLRKLLVQGAQTVLTSACPKPNSKRAVQQQENPATMKSDDLHVFARHLRARKPRPLVVMAIANRMARMLYAMLKSGLAYRGRRIRESAIMA